MTAPTLPCTREELGDRTRWPKAMRALASALEAARWRIEVGAGSDDLGNPFLTVESQDPAESCNAVRVVWHTRDSGTYRLFSCLLMRPYRGWQHATLKAVHKFVAEVSQ